LKLKDINAATTFDLWITPTKTNDAIVAGLGQIKPTRSRNEYDLIINKRIYKINLRDPSTGTDLNFHLKRGCAHLVETIQTAKDGSTRLIIIFFCGDIVEIGNIEVGIDERIETTARRNGINFNDAEKLGEHLAKKCTLSIGSETFFLMMCGDAADADFESEDSADSNMKNDQNIIPAKQYREFSIYGERLRIPVEKRNIEKSKDIFFATKVIFRDSQKREGALRLAKGHVSFSDYTQIGRIRALAAGAMSQLTKETGSYLKRWDEYGDVEGEMLLARAKSVGRIDYHNTEKTAKGVKFFISSAPPDSLSGGDEMELTSEEPPYLKNPDINWKEYSKSLEEEFTAKKETQQNEDNREPDSMHAQVIELSQTSIELAALPSMPSEQMFLVLSINGEKIQIERRMRARSAILQGRSANPLLGLLIEEGGELPDIQRVTKLKPLTPFVKEKIFKHPPTNKQVEAIKIALNTPDIAVIQGPPGTGKTTVITAILERLNEEYDKTSSIRGQILVSGFQHDAVENIVSRLSVNALPAVKFGGRSSDSEFVEDAVTEKMNKWCFSITESIRNKNPQIVKTEDQIRLAELFNTYSLCPSSNNTRNLLKRILDLPRNVLSEEITSQAEHLLNSFQSEAVASDPITIRLIRSLRISEISFMDDGPIGAIDLLERIEEDLSVTDLKILEKASQWRNGKELDFFDKLKALKEELLFRYMPMPEFRTEKPREDILNLVVKVSAQFEKTTSLKNKRDAVLAEFLHELEDNPDGVRKSIEDYSFVFAATTQQSVGRLIKSAKTKFKDETVKYDTVIIDEAARTSPRDLLIPMSQAEKRIILVGDHRQLPHIINEDVVAVVEKKANNKEKQESDYVRESMFAYLFRRLKKLEEKDNIKRTVTLDAQYRTHPMLGDFVSDNFYKQHGEEYDSPPLPEKYFTQNLQDIQGHAAVWIDIPNHQGKEKKLKTHSRQRTAEAKVIAEFLSKWLSSEEASELSFGVISFYKAQEYAVYQELKAFGVTEHAPDRTWQIAEKYRFLHKNINGKEEMEERLRIGTVDAFQGMEFDIILLSMVRSLNPDHLPPHIRNESDYRKKQQKIFGHLMSENRLCVSMSRQKRVLVVVGDGDLIQSQIAIDAVPALKNFYDLCKEQGVIL
jgi:hypothetical protein